MKNKLVLSLLIGAMAFPLAATPAVASHTTATRTDPNDTRGRLDIRKVRYVGHQDNTATLFLRTQRKWKCNFLRGVADAPHTYSAGLSWEINRNRDPQNEKSGHFSCENGKLFFRVNNGDAIRAQRPGPRIAKVRIPLKPTKHLSMYAISRITGEVDGQVFADEEDVAPEEHLEPYK